MTKTAIPDEWDLDSTLLHKRRNMEFAMRGSIERALVELITNADDSYRDCEEEGEQISGKIRIEIQRKNMGPSKVVVKDRARGMTRAELYNNLGELGRRTSGFEKGKARRGLHGRGARDVAAFGPVQFESVKDGEYNCLIIPPTLKCRFTRSAREATRDVRESLGVSKAGNGTVVTIEVGERWPIPWHRNLKADFSRYFSLRDIFSNSQREVSLVDVNSGAESRLSYVYPAGEDAFEGDVAVPGYPDASAHLVIRTHETPFDMGQQLPYREGILVKSAAAIHDCTYLGLDSDPFAWRFSGELRCNFIDTLVREYDDREEANPDLPNHPKDNPMRLLDPQRDGLMRQHPFARALYSKCKEVLRPLVEELRAAETPPTRDVTDENLERRLGRLSRKISKVFEKKAKELEEDIPAGPIDGGLIDKLGVGLHIIPPGEHPITANEPKTFSVIVKHYEALDDSLPLNIASSHPEEVKIRTSPVFLRRLSEDRKIGRATFTVQSSRVGAEAIIAASHSGYEELLLLKVVEPPEAPQLPSEGLSFEKPLYHLRINREKTLLLRLRTPTKMVGRPSAVVASDYGEVVVKGGGRCSLRSTETPNVFLGRVRILGRELNARAEVSARVEGFGPAKTDVVVKERLPSSGLQLRFLPVEENFRSVRYMWDTEDPNLLKIGATHPSIRRYLGQPNGGKYPGVDSELYHTVLAEVIAEALAFNLLEKHFKSEGQGMLDYAAADAYYHRDFSDFLSIAHEELVATSVGE